MDYETTFSLNAALLLRLRVASNYVHVYIKPKKNVTKVLYCLHGKVFLEQFQLEMKGIHITYVKTLASAGG